jgi:hypothetical protein
MTGFRVISVDPTSARGSPDMQDDADENHHTAWQRQG